jgi:putative transposase
MARPLRVEYPGAFYHVMNRGNAGEEIFTRNIEKRRFLDCLQRASSRFFFRVHGYCVMSNHYHLLLETPQPNLSRAIQWLNVSYSVWYNRYHNRRGHVFQGRFKALLVQADSYLNTLSQYIHLNPVRAGIVQKPEEYSWCSYLDFLGQRQAPDWLETDRILTELHPHRPEAIRRYRAMIESYVGVKGPDVHAAGGFILGCDDFVEQIKRTHLRDREMNAEMPQLRELRKLALEVVMKAVCAEFAETEEQIRRKGGRGCLPRLVAIGLAKDLCGMGGKELGLYFGGISGAAITMIGKRFEREIFSNSVLKSRVGRIRENCFQI